MFNALSVEISTLLSLRFFPITTVHCLVIVIHIERDEYDRGQFTALIIRINLFIFLEFSGYFERGML
jgi:hypothetical protein